MFVGRRDTVQRLYVRDLDGVEARPLEGTEGAQVPAVSADGRWVAFWANGAIMRVPLQGGPGTVLVKDSGRFPPTGMEWGEDGRLFYARLGGAVWSVEPERPPSQVTRKLAGETAHTTPHLLPGPRALLYTVRRRNFTWGDEEVVAQIFATGERKVLLEDATDARYVASGHLVFLRRGALLAVGFDLARLEVVGTPVPVLDDVAQALTSGNWNNITGAGQFSVASTGTLAWLPGGVAPGPEGNIVAIDRQGQVRTLSNQPRAYRSDVSLSPDGRQIAAGVTSLTEAAVWTFELERGTFTRLPGEGESTWPRWTADGQSIVYESLRKGVGGLARQRMDRTDAPEMLAGDPGGIPSSWSSDGWFAASSGADPAGDIWIGTLGAGTVTAKRLMETPERETSPEFSPDGRWLAYATNASGRSEVQVQPYPGPGPRRQVSLAGGESPAWNLAGRELFFLSVPDPDGRRHMMSVAVAFGPTTLSLGTPRRLFTFSQPPLNLSCIPIRCYAVSPDGQLFYAVQLVPTQTPPPGTQINLVTHWIEEMKAKVAAGQAKRP